MELITREQWGARNPRGTRTPVSPANRTEVFAHWNGPALHITSHAQCLSAVKAMQVYHQDGRGWVDIGYNALVCPHGYAIEGRGIDYKGAHCVDHNTSGYGIQIMCGQGESPTAIQLVKTRELVQFLDAHSGKTLTRKGHRDGMSTSCPGDEIYQWIHGGMPTQPTLPPVTPPTPTTPPPMIPTTLRRGSAGPRVYALQTGLLRVFPAYAGPIRTNGGPNGIFGPATESVVKEFQRRAGITSDGIVGPVTTRKLAAYGVTF